MIRKSSEMDDNYDSFMMSKSFLPYRMGYLTDWMVEKARTELNETEENRSQAIEELRTLIASEKQLDVWNDDAYLLQFLRARKFDVKRAWDLIQHFYAVKRDFPEVYPKDLDIEKIKTIQEVSKGGGAYPYRDKNGCPVFFFKIGEWDPEKFPLSVAISSMTFAVLQGIEDPATQVCGMQVLVDAKNFSLKHLLTLTPRYLQLFAQGMRNTLPIRFKEIHVINESAIYSLMYNILKLFLSEKIKERIHFYGNDIKKLHKSIPKEILPAEYGGDNTNYNACEWVKKEMYPFLEKFRELHQRGF